MTSRLALCSLASLLSLVGVLVVNQLLIPTPVHRLTDGCVRYWQIRSFWICGDSVYEIQFGKRMWAGKVSALHPTPQAPPKEPSESHHS